MKAVIICAQCTKHKATLYRKDGKTQRSPNHDLCRQCWRKICDQVRQAA